MWCCGVISSPSLFFFEFTGLLLGIFSVFSLWMNKKADLTDVVQSFRSLTYSCMDIPSELHIDLAVVCGVCHILRMYVSVLCVWISLPSTHFFLSFSLNFQSDPLVSLVCVFACPDKSACVWFVCASHIVFYPSDQSHFLSCHRVDAAVIAWLCVRKLWQRLVNLELLFQPTIPKVRK